jgi:3-isopropylmalate/(R)-2-methylmalate dehydratase small subunit
MRLRASRAPVSGQSSANRSRRSSRATRACAAPIDIERLQALIERTPDTVIHADVPSGAISAGSTRIAAALPPALRDSFISGQWNPTAMLLHDFGQVADVAKRLPYIAGF